MLKRTRIIAPAVFVAMLAALLTFAFASTAFAAPGVTNAKFSNPVAYELKSLLSTRFTCDVDTPGTWGRLDILGANGVVKTVYNGPLTQGTNWFPLWNGYGANGKRLPSASYDWRLTVTKGGESTIVRGKLTVSKIHFVISGQADPDTPYFYSRYMMPGNANVYSRIVNNSGDTSCLTLAMFFSPNTEELGYIYWWTNPNSVLNYTHYTRDYFDLKYRGVHTIGVMASEDSTFYMTVIQ